MSFSLCRNGQVRHKLLTFFMISVRSPGASSSGVGGSGRFGGPGGGSCGGVDGTASSESTLKPGLYEIGLMYQKRKKRTRRGRQNGWLNVGWQQDGEMKRNRFHRDN